MVSVVIPTYNRAQYIAETIDSVRAQSYPNVEIIVIDDGSTDDTAEVVARFGSRVRYVHQQNSERSVARNHGLKLSKAEFVAFLDSDDCWDADALRLMVQALRRDPALALVAAGCVISAGEKGNTQEFRPGGGADGVLPNAFNQLLRSNVIGSPSAVLVRRRALERFGHFEEDRRVIGVEDWELWTRIAFEAPVACIPRTLVRYRRHEGNSPLIGMRLRYPWLVDALLRKLPLSRRERDEMSTACAMRLVDYAGEFFEMKQPDGVQHCLTEAKRLHPPVSHDTAFERLMQQSALDERNMAVGFTTMISSQEGLGEDQAFQKTFRRIMADRDNAAPPR